jgi:deoxyribodipyrimidine photo-lyase
MHNVKSGKIHTTDMDFSPWIRTFGNEKEQKGDYVLYWMQSSQRVHSNRALEYAIFRANKLDLPILVLFVLTNYPEANLRHLTFMLEGLSEVQEELEKRRILLAMRIGSPPDVVSDFATDAALVVTDCGYQGLLRQWREVAAQQIHCPLIEVESNVVVPVGLVSGKEEWSAATLRRKMQQYIDSFLAPIPMLKPARSSLSLEESSPSFASGEEVLRQLDVDRSVPSSQVYRGGYSECKRRLDEFVEHKLAGYGEARNDPNKGALSCMSMYLHFGQVSPLEIALAVKGRKGANAYLEELIVRRELAMNFVRYNPDYDSYACLQTWAKKTLEEHRGDFREYVYSPAEFERADTHDPYWNAAQREMVATGKMHGYMRMYWGKKLLEWSKFPEEAYDTALYLNNKYEIDGRDPNGYAGIAWCFGKHDRPWKEREVFGKVRYMNARGLKRKFDADAYVRKVEEL